VLWALTDQVGSVRDAVTFDEASETTTVRIHRVYDSFGNLTEEELRDAAGQVVTPGQPGALGLLFGFTGRPFDADADLQWNLHRWYDAAVGRWLSEDPIGFTAGDENLYRYCGNRPVLLVDPTGFQASVDAGQGVFQLPEFPILPSSQDRPVIEEFLAEKVFGPWAAWAERWLDVGEGRVYVRGKLWVEGEAISHLGRGDVLGALVAFLKDFPQEYRGRQLNFKELKEALERTLWRHFRVGWQFEECDPIERLRCRIEEFRRRYPGLLELGIAAAWYGLDRAGGVQGLIGENVPHWFQKRLDRYITRPVWEGPRWRLFGPPAGATEGFASPFADWLDLQPRLEMGFNPWRGSTRVVPILEMPYHWGTHSGSLQLRYYGGKLDESDDQPRLLLELRSKW